KRGGSSPGAGRTAPSPGSGGGCRASCARSPITCCQWTNRITGGCAKSSMKPSAVAPSSRWSRASSPSPTRSPTDCSRRAYPPTSSRQLPLAVICELLGLPLADRAKFTAWAGGFTRFTGTIGFISMIPKIVVSFYAMRRYLEQQLEVARESGGEGLIAELVRVEKNGGQISRNEMVSMVFLLLFAGHETTTHLISGSVHELLKNPELREWLEEDWSRANLAVEEFLRFLSPVQFTKPRYVRRELEL